MAARLARVLRQIAQVRRRLGELVTLEAGLREDALWRLYEVVVTARADGSNRLASWRRTSALGLHPARRAWQLFHSYPAPVPDNQW
ncbi:MAG: hypothetical protein H0U94_11915 [Acidobacteria bacterium]|nr:hypothetical protein [Acidobacteriota bacterium]